MDDEEIWTKELFDLVKYRTSSDFRVVTEETRISELDQILKHVCDINVKDNENNTLLHVATSKGYTEVVKFLLSKRIDRNFVNKNGHTALDIARERGKQEIIDILSDDQEPSTSTQNSFKAEGDSYDEQDGHVGLKRSLEIHTQNQPSKKGRLSDLYYDNIIFPGGDKTLNEHGTIFQNKLLMLFLWRAMISNYEKFRLATEFKEAGKFDDVVFQYKDENGWKFRLLQAKHQEPENNETPLKSIKRDDLLSVNNENPFSLQKYFHSYLKVRTRSQEKSVYCVFAESQIEDVIVVTNTDFNENLKGSFSKVSLEKDTLLKVDKSCEQPVAYQIKRATNFVKDLKIVFDITSDFNILIESLAQHLADITDHTTKKALELKPIIKDYYYPLLYQVFEIVNTEKDAHLKFREEFIDSNTNEFSVHLIKEIAFRRWYFGRELENIETFSQLQNESNLPEDDKSQKRIAKVLADKCFDKVQINISDFQSDHVAIAQKVLSTKTKKFLSKFVKDKSVLKDYFKKIFANKVSKRITNKQLEILTFNLSDDFGKVSLPNDLNTLNSIVDEFLDILKNKPKRHDNKLKIYSSTLLGDIINIDNKKFTMKFLAGSELQPSLKKFRKILILKLINPKIIVNTVNSLKMLRVKISTTFLNNYIQKDIKIEDMDKFTQQLSKILSDNCDGEENVEIEVNDDSVPKDELKCFQQNLRSISGHVLVNVFKKIRVGSVFLNDRLDENLGYFKQHLIDKLGTTKFEALAGIQFHIKFPFPTCEDGAIYRNLPSQYSEEDVEDFFRDLKFIVKYPNRRQLNDILSKDIGERFKRLDDGAKLAMFYEKIHEWMSGRVGSFLTPKQAKIIFDEISSRLLPWTLDALNRKHLRERSTCLRFQKYDIVTHFLESQELVLYLSCPNQEIGGFRVKQMFNYLKKENLEGLRPYTYTDGHIFMNVKELNLFFKDIIQCVANPDKYNLIVIVHKNKTDNTENISELYEKLKFHSKKLILISEDKNEELLKILKINPYRDETTYNNLTEDCQNDLLKRPCIIFQGHKEKLRFLNIIGELSANVNKQERDNILNAFFTLDILVEVLKGRDIKIGKSLKNIKDIDSDVEYIKRFFYQPLVLSFHKFKEDVDNKTLKDKCVIFNTKVEWPDAEATIKLSPKRNEVEAENDFNDFCTRFNGPVHLLKKVNSNLILKKSRGSIGNLIKCKSNSNTLGEDSFKERIEEDDLIRNNVEDHRLIVISAIAGMGKSMTLAHLSTQLKKTYPHFWIIHIDLQKYCDVLNEEKKARDNSLEASKPSFEWACNFLLDKLLDAHPSSRLNDIEKVLFKFNLKLHSRVILIFDEFDHISPAYDQIVIDLIKHIKSNVEKVCVATRPTMRDYLENELKVFCYMFHSFNDEDNIRFLINYWKNRLELSEVNKETAEKKMAIYAKDIVQKLNRSLTDRDRKFLAAPLLTHLIAAISESKEDEDWKGCKEFLSDPSYQPVLPKEFNLLNLYNQFVDKMFTTFCEKQDLNESHTGVRILIDKDKSEFYERHQNVALRALFSGETLRKLISTRKLKENLLETQNHLSKGLVSEIDQNKPIFIHRTFAEYFVATHIKEKIKSSRKKGLESVLYSKIFVLPEFKIVRHFLYNMEKEEHLGDENLSEFLETLRKLDENPTDFDCDDKNIFEKILIKSKSDSSSKNDIRHIIDTIKFKPNGFKVIESLVTKYCIQYALNKDLILSFDLLLKNVTNLNTLKILLKSQQQVFKNLKTDSPLKEVVEKHVSLLPEDQQKDFKFT